MRVLLISNSGMLFLEHCTPAIAGFLGGRRRLAFVTAASLGDEAVYHGRARDALGPAPPAGLGLEVLHLRWDADPLATLERAEALFVGGGNTYALLKRLRAARSCSSRSAHASATGCPTSARARARTSPARTS
ncbi:MAG: Type 1 glutamine amidotransferase-like domain-containing protein [Candidatus Rokubacteria bacterium]|nr:Type 1 glutamine amidotransferase-like domain-containing protein [Candidatus Rokubacteria bacterium]